MGYWITARKGSASLHLTYGSGFSNNVFAHNSRVWSEGPDIELRIDLNPNLRVRAKDSGTCVDARDLADGQIDHLKFIQIDDEAVLKVVKRVLEGLPERPPRWWVTLELEGERRFEVKPEIRQRSLFLHVIEFEGTQPALRPDKPRRRR